MASVRVIYLAILNELTRKRLLRRVVTVSARVFC